MIRAIHQRLDEREEGFTLIELLVVVIIIGILAAIAIPAFLNQRERAWVSSVESDLRNAAVQLETVFTETDAYPADQAAFGALVTSGDVQVSTGTTQAGTATAGITYIKDGANTYCLAASHANLQDAPVATQASYDSDGGGLMDTPSATCV